MVTSLEILHNKLFALAMERGCFPEGDPSWQLSWKKEKIRKMCEDQKIVMVKFGHHWDTAVEIPSETDGETNRLRYVSEADGSIHLKDPSEVQPVFEKEVLDKILNEEKKKNADRWMNVIIDGIPYPARNLMYTREEFYFASAYDDEKSFEFEVMKGLELQVVHVKKGEIVEESLKEIGGDDFVAYFDFIKEAESIDADGPWFPAYIIQELEDDFFLVHWPYEKRTDVRRRIDTETYWLELAQEGFVLPDPPRETVTSDNESDTYPDYNTSDTFQSTTDANQENDIHVHRSTHHDQRDIEGKNIGASSKIEKNTSNKRHKAGTISNEDGEEQYSREEVNARLHAAFVNQDDRWVKVLFGKKWWPARLVKDDGEIAYVQWNGRGDHTVVKKSMVEQLLPVSHQFAPYEVDFSSFGGWRNSENVHVLREFENEFLQIYWIDTNKSEVHSKEKTRKITQCSSDEGIGGVEAMESESDWDAERRENASTPKQLPHPAVDLRSQPSDDAVYQPEFDFANTSVYQLSEKVPNTSSAESSESEVSCVAPKGFPLTDEVLDEKTREEWVKYREGKRLYVGKIVNCRSSHTVEVQWSGSKETVCLITSSVSRLNVVSNNDFQPINVEMKSRDGELNPGIIIQEYELDFVLVYRPSSGETEVVSRKRILMPGQKSDDETTSIKPASEHLQSQSQSQLPKSIDESDPSIQERIKGNSPLSWISRSSAPTL